MGSWRKKEKVRNYEAILTTRLQMLGARRGCETGRVSLLLCIDVKLGPNTSFYITK
jgi:hypothetical protein